MPMPLPLFLLLLITLPPLMAARQFLPFHTLPLFGNTTLSYYFVQIDIGTPPQTQSLIVDTGSGLFAVPCQGCRNCGKEHIHRPFSTNLSTTSSYLMCDKAKEYERGTLSKVCGNCGGKGKETICDFQITYVEGSRLEGVMVKDYITLDEKGEKVKAVFGCTLLETNLFVEQKADGVMGLSPNRDHNLLQKVYKAHTTQSHETLSFGLCLAENGGRMTIGNIDPALLGQNYVQIPYISNLNLYSLTANSVSYGNFTLQITLQELGSMRMFIDSGATYSYFPRVHYLKVEHQIIQIADSIKLAYVHQKDNLCFMIPSRRNLTQIINSFPNITIHMEGGVSLDWPPNLYWIKDNDQYYCLGLEPYDRFLLGTSWMINRYIHFDIQTRTLKISRADCIFKKQQHKSTVANPKINKQNASISQKVQQIPQQTQQQLSAIGAEKDEQIQHEDRQMKILVVFGTIIVLVCFFCPFIIQYRRHRLQNRVFSGNYYMTPSQTREEEMMQERHQDEIH